MKFGKINKYFESNSPINKKQQETIDRFIRDIEQTRDGSSLMYQSERVEFNFNVNVVSAWESNKKGWLSISISADKDLNFEGHITEFISGYIKTNGTFIGKINRWGIPFKKMETGGNINNFNYTIGGL